jgi:hypothetical protein
MHMRSSFNPGRLAGLLYLLLGFSVFRPIYIANTLIVRDNAAVTTHNIAAHELLFRFGILTDVLAGLSCIAVAFALYRVLQGVDRNLAVLMVILGGLMPAVTDCLNVLNDLAALMLARGDIFPSTLPRPQQAALAMLFLRIHEYGFVVIEVFAGLWLFPFGILVYRSRFIPRLIGAWLVVNGFGYLAISFTAILVPEYVDKVTSIVTPALLGEGAIMLWLLIKGANPEPVRENSSTLTA